MKVVIYCVGRTDVSHVKESIEIYSDRLKHYIPTELCIIQEHKTWKKLNSDMRKRAEGEAIVSKLESGDCVVLLDENGKQYTSEDFAKYLQKEMSRGVKRLVFVIGGAYGFSEEVYTRFPAKLSLSKMTFSHQMIRTILLEQIYRGMTILKNEPYHNR